MRRTWVIVAACFGVVVVVCAIGGWFVWSRTDIAQAAAQLDQAIADAKAAGLPWTAADMAPKPPVKDSDNAAPLLGRCKELIEREPVVIQGLKDLEKPQTYNDVQGMRAAITELKPLLSVARAAADKPRCDFHRDWDEGPWLTFPEEVSAKHIARLLSAEAVCEAADGDESGALKDLDRVFAMGRHVGSDPILIGMLVDLACDAIVARAAERVAEQWHSEPERLERLRAMLVRCGEPDIRYALKGESYMGVALLRNVHSLRQFNAIAKGGSGDPGDNESNYEAMKPKAFVRSGAPDTFFGRVMLCRNLQVWTRFKHESGQTTDPMKVSKILGDLSEQESHMGWSHLANQILLPVFSQAGSAVVRERATRVCTAGLAAVLAYKARHGRYPKTLAEAGVTDLDPFDGKPLKLRIDGDGCRVYSVGPDGMDDGGVRREDLKNASDKGWDVVASYPAYVPRAR
jgi:hypothetical protein